VSGAFDLHAGVRRGRVYFHELECLRGWAIVLVFLFHAWGISRGGAAVEVSPWLAFVAAGNTGVTLFFVLSGFLLTLPWLRCLHQDAPEPAIGRYLAARALRILPLYYTAVLVAFISTGDLAPALRALRFGFVAFDLFPWSVVWWTLITELQFYLLLPVAGWLACRGPAARRLLALLLVAWLCLYLALVIAPSAEPRGFALTKSLFARLPAFALGALAARLYLLRHFRRGASGAAAVAGRLLAVLGSLGLLALVLQAVTAMGDRAAEQSWHQHHAWESALWTVIMLALLHGSFPGRALLVNPVTAWLGKLSYSIYLNHVPLLFYLVYPARSADPDYVASPALYALPLLAAALSLALAVLSYRFLELPALRLKGRLSL
jgi:peptidoglycan/LPS O-acetylase OafA/YrhL